MGARITCIIPLLALLVLPACAGALFSVKSDPMQAEVFFIDPKSGDKKSLGKTPLELPSSALKQVAGESVDSGEFFTVLVEKPGYVSEKFNVPSSKFGTLVTALDVKLKQGSTPKERGAARDVLNHLFLAQKLALAREYDRAQVELDHLLRIFPDFARALSMRASIYYMQKNYAESLKWYEEAVKADPQMDDAVKMIAKVRALQGGRAPASGESKP